MSLHKLPAGKRKETFEVYESFLNKLGWDSTEKGLLVFPEYEEALTAAILLTKTVKNYVGGNFVTLVIHKLTSVEIDGVTLSWDYGSDCLVYRIECTVEYEEESDESFRKRVEIYKRNKRDKINTLKKQLKALEEDD
jgi:hypothetical protein